MNLKKIFAAAVLCGTIAAGAFASDNHTCGIDIASGLVGYESTTFTGNYPLRRRDYSYVGVPFLSLKVNTYDCFLLNDLLGIYASIGINPEAMVDFGVSGDRDSSAWVGVGIEFMVGPAIGLDLGDSGICFQTGVPFHAEFGAFFDEEKKLDVTTKKTREYSSFGVGLTPQFRFFANRRCSLVVGADFIFDFVMKLKQKTEVNGNTTTFNIEPKNVFRFRALPYIGLGINFGD